MGAGASTDNNLEELTREQAQAFAGDRWDEKKFDELAIDGIIKNDVLVAEAAKTDVAEPAKPADPAVSAEPEAEPTPANESYTIVWEDGIHVRARLPKEFTATIGVLDCNAEVEALEKRDNWIQIKHGDANGWVLTKAPDEWGNADLLEEVGESEGKTYKVVWCDGVNIQAAPSAEYVPLIATKEKGEVVEVKSKADGWYELAEGGWVMSKGPESWGSPEFLKLCMSAVEAA